MITYFFKVKNINSYGYLFKNIACNHFLFWDINDSYALIFSVKSDFAFFKIKPQTYNKIIKMAFMFEQSFEFPGKATRKHKDFLLFYP